MGDIIVIHSERIIPIPVAAKRRLRPEVGYLSDVENYSICNPVWSYLSLVEEDFGLCRN